jgi:hypothetical protein
MTRAVTRHHVHRRDSVAVPSVKELVHNSITVGDLEASIFFWRDVLAFELKRGTSA